MFDIAFSELLVIAIVAVVVIGPEKLPKVVRTVGRLLGRMQRYVNDVKTDINREIQMEELQRLQNDVKQELQEMKASLHDSTIAIERELQGIAQLPPEEQEKLASIEVRTAPPSPRKFTSKEALQQQPDQESQQPGGTTN